MLPAVKVGQASESTAIARPRRRDAGPGAGLQRSMVAVHRLKMPFGASFRPLSVW
jgi:hypothetical protein